jgi:hypothetical protein
MSRKEHMWSDRVGRGAGLPLGRFKRVAVAVAVILTAALCMAAHADDNAITPSSPPSGAASATPSASPSLAPSEAPSKVKVFLIAPEESDQDFMCESGRVQSVLAYAIAEHRIVSITFLDQSKNPVAEGVWSSAYGFRLTHRQNVKINVTLICGN